MLHAYVAKLKKYAEENRAKEQAQREERGLVRPFHFLGRYRWSRIAS
jgi:hypothetical protein